MTARRLFPKLTRLHRLVWARFWLGWFLIVVVPRCTATKQIANNMLKKSKRGLWCLWRGLAWGTEMLLKTRVVETLVELLILVFSEEKVRKILQHWKYSFDAEPLGLTVPTMFLVLLIRCWVKNGMQNFREFRERRLVDRISNGSWAYEENEKGAVDKSVDLIVKAKTFCFGQNRKNVIYCYPVSSK